MHLSCNINKLRFNNSRLLDFSNHRVYMIGKLCDLFLFHFILVLVELLFLL